MVRWNYFFLYIGRESPWLILLLFLSWVHSPMVKVAPAQFIWLVAPPTCTPRLTQVSSLIFCVEKSTFTLPCPTSGQSLFNLHSVQRQSVTIATSSIMLVRAIQNSWPQKNICNKQTNNPSMTSNNRWMLQKKKETNKWYHSTQSFSHVWRPSCSRETLSERVFRDYFGS